MKTKKICAVASIGGHWIQLLRIIRPLEQKYDITYISTHPKSSTMVCGQKFFLIKDFNRWNFYLIFPTFLQVLKILYKESPDIVISTGAAPGLITLLTAKLLNKKTIWIDSIANVEHLSFSGKIASKFVSQLYTQWEDLSNNKILYKGNIFG